MKKLIIIRGNSGSGKSTIAKELRMHASQPNRVALVEQDYLRRIVLKEKESEDINNIDLIEQTVKFAFARGYDVILEGILYSARYKQMLQKLISIASEAHIFYMDVSLEETLNRHASKPNAHEFGEKEMREWYKEHDVLGVEDEHVIPESSTFKNTVETLRLVTGL